MNLTISNPSFDVMKIDRPLGQLSPLGRIIKSDIAECFSIDTGSCVNRSSIGEYFGLGCYSYVADAVVGRYCTFASRVSVGPFNHPTNWLSIHEFQYRDLTSLYGKTIVTTETRAQVLDPRTTIGADVWIGDNAIVRRGISIGAGAVIGMGTVVVKDVPPYAIVVGNPGRVIKYRFSPEIVEALLELRWWRLDLMALDGIDYSNVENAIAILRERIADHLEPDESNQ